MVEEGDDSLDEEGGREAQLHGRADDDSDDQFADDEAASNQGDSSSQEYLEDHYAGWPVIYLSNILGDRTENFYMGDCTKNCRFRFADI